MRKWAIRTVALLLVALGVTAITTTPAHASFGECTGAEICTWRNTPYWGGMYYYTSPALTCVEIGGDWDNAISSIANRFSDTVIFYENHGCWGSTYTLSGSCGCSTDHAANMGLNMNDKISSFFRF